MGRMGQDRVCLSPLGHGVACRPPPVLAMLMGPALGLRGHKPPLRAGVLEAAGCSCSHLLLVHHPRLVLLLGMPGLLGPHGFSLLR